MALVVISFMNPRRISKSAPVILNALVNVLTGESVLEVTLGFFGFGAEAFLDLGAFSGLATGLSSSLVQQTLHLLLMTPCN